MNPTQLVWVQMDFESERYCVLFKMTNRQKKRDVDCTVCTYDDVVGRTTCGRQLLDSWHVTWFVGSEWDGDTWPNQWPPCVTCLLVKIFALGRSRPHDLRGRVKLWERPPNRRAHTCYLIYKYIVIYLTLYKCVLGREPGWC
jgi:hypothetical protein